MTEKERADREIALLRQHKAGRKLRRFRLRDELRNGPQHDRLDDAIHVANLRYVARLNRLVLLVESKRPRGCRDSAAPHHPLISEYGNYDLKPQSIQNAER